MRAYVRKLGSLTFAFQILPSFFLFSICLIRRGTIGFSSAVFPNLF